MELSLDNIQALGSRYYSAGPARQRCTTRHLLRANSYAVLHSLFFICFPPPSTLFMSVGASYHKNLSPSYITILFCNINSCNWFLFSDCVYCVFYAALIPGFLGRTAQKSKEKINKINTYCKSSIVGASVCSACFIYFPNTCCCNDICALIFVFENNKKKHFLHKIEAVQGSVERFLFYLN